MEASIQLHAPATLPPVKEGCPLHFINKVGDWVCARVGVQTLEKKKNHPCRESNHAVSY
jgi:hypothetical protein